MSHSTTAEPPRAPWFDGLSISHDADGSTTLAGPVIDLSALYGLLSTARDLGLVIILAVLVGPEHPADATAG